MAEATLFVLVQIPFGVDVDSVDNDADMQMISGHIAGSTDFGNGVVFVHRIANLSQKLADVLFLLALDIGTKADGLLVQPLFDDLFQTFERTTTDKQNICCINGCHRIYHIHAC